MRHEVSISHSRFTELSDKYAAGAEGLRLLNGDTQAVRERSGVWSNTYVAEKYVAETDKLIGVMDGTIGERTLPDGVNPEDEQPAPSVVVWLDKSARPVSWFADAFWDQFARPDAKKPTDAFLNIDRTDWFERQGHTREDASSRLGPNDFDIDKVPTEEIARIRALFVQGDLAAETWQEDVWTMPALLDNQDILIIDEVMNKGGTLAIAQQLLQRAFPTARVSGDYFWKTGRYALDAKGEEKQMESAPVWYDAHSAFGRGVGDISQMYFAEMLRRNPDDPDALKKSIGWIALSAPHFDEAFAPVPDKKAELLKEDIQVLADRVAAGGILRTPSAFRSDEEIYRIVEAQGLTYDEYVAYRQRVSEKNRAGRK